MIDKIKVIKEYRDEVVKVLLQIDDNSIAAVAQALLFARDNESMIFVFGNGGSAATASRFVGDLLKGVSYGNEKKFKAICLSDNISSMMALSNDVSYEEIFIEPLKNFAKPNDVVIGISGSGNSKNVVKALEYANSIGAVTIALSGYEGGLVKRLAHIKVHVIINDMEVVEAVCMSFLHCVKKVLMLTIQEEKSNCFSVKQLI